MYAHFGKVQFVLLLKEFVILLHILVSIQQEDMSVWKFSAPSVWVMSIVLCQILGRLGDFK